MQNRKVQLVLFTAILAIYNYLFWGQSSGVNLPLFSLLLGITAALINPQCLRSRRVRITAAGTFVSGLLVVINHTSLSMTVHVLSFFAMLGFMQEQELKSLYNALLQSLTGLLRAPLELLRTLSAKAEQNSKTAKVFRLIRLVVFPSVALLVFYFIYRIANPVFDKLSLKLTRFIDRFFNWLFSHISMEWIIFMGLGMVVISVILFRTISKRWRNADSDENEKLVRKRTSRKKQALLVSSFSSVALKNERRSGIIFLVMVNLLLAVVNFIDINWIWFGFHVPQHFNLKQFVHEGTYMLIFSILLSMAILLYLFRKNQNFLQGNKHLKRLAYLWLSQNAILCISVLLRNYHYIHYHGLAYKRIGVIVFLALTFFGLLTLFIKIKELRSRAYLQRRNTWFAYGVLLLLCFFNWDLIIVRYNLNHWNSDDIDTSFYLSLSHHALPELLANKEKVKRQMELHKQNPERWLNELNYGNFEYDLNTRRKLFLFEQENKQWQSWNYADAATYRELKEMKKPVAELRK